MQKRRLTLSYQAAEREIRESQLKENCNKSGYAELDREEIIIDLVVSSIKEILNLSVGDLNRLLERIDQKYTEVLE